MNKKAQAAWELYLKMETSSESFGLLQLISNDCYKTEQYLYAAKAFDVLERLDPSPEYWEGKRGACVGAFKQCISGTQNQDQYREILSLLRNSTNPQVEYIVRVMKNVTLINLVHQRKPNSSLKAKDTVFLSKRLIKLAALNNHFPILSSITTQVS